MASGKAVEAAPRLTHPLAIVNAPQPPPQPPDDVLDRLKCHYQILLLINVRSHCMDSRERLPPCDAPLGMFCRPGHAIQTPKVKPKVTNNMKFISNLILKNCHSFQILDELSGINCN
jgi:hypothetical protein